MTDSATQLPHGGKQPFSGKLVIAVVSLAILTFLGILSETSLNIAYSTLMEEFSIGASVVQWLVTGYLLLLSVSIPSSPFMVRKFATKTLFIMAVVIFAAGTLLGALAVNFPMLLAARLVMSLGAGISLPLITSIILEKAPLEQRGCDARHRRPGHLRCTGHRPGIRRRAEEPLPAQVHPQRLRRHRDHGRGVR